MKPALLLVLFFFGQALRLVADETLSSARFEQRLGEPLPLTTEFLEANGERHALGDYFHGRPVVLYFGYARCPQLCSIVADGTVTALRQIRPTVGTDLEVISVSLDPSETMAEGKNRETEAVRRYGHSGAAKGWHFLIGSDAAVRAIADASGFHYTYDPRSHQYAHPSGFIVITPEGTVSRYFLGVDFSPGEVAEAIAQAGRGKTGASVTDVLLLCFRGEAIGGRYGAIIWRTLGIAVALTVVALAGGIGWMLRHEGRTRAGEGSRP